MEKNKILGKEPFKGGVTNLEPLAYIWMDFREYLAPSYTHNFVVCVHF